MYDAINFHVWERLWYFVENGYVVQWFQKGGSDESTK